MVKKKASEYSRINISLFSKIPGKSLEAFIFVIIASPQMKTRSICPYNYQQ